MPHQYVQTQIAYATSDTATISSTAKPITHADFGWGENEVETAEKAYVTVALGDIRFTWDGVTTPTTTVGMLVAASKSFIVTGNQNIRNLNFIRATGVDAALSITLEK